MCTPCRGRKIRCIGHSEHAVRRHQVCDVLLCRRSVWQWGPGAVGSEGIGELWSDAGFALFRVSCPLALGPLGARGVGDAAGALLGFFFCVASAFASGVGLSRSLSSSSSSQRQAPACIVTRVKAISQCTLFRRRGEGDIVFTARVITVRRRLALIRLMCLLALAPMFERVLLHTRKRALQIRSVHEIEMNQKPLHRHLPTPPETVASSCEFEKVFQLRVRALLQMGSHAEANQ